MSASLTKAQLAADVRFLLARADAAGSINFGRGRWTGTSSNSLVAFAYGGEHRCMPSDRGDYTACVLTYRRLPAHRRTPAVKAALAKARAAYLERYPVDRFPAERNEQRRVWAEQAAKARKGRRRRR